MKIQKTKPVELRFTRAASILRSLKVSENTKELQKDLSWMKKDIEDYGLEFFPNHYVYDKVKEFEALVDALKNHPSTNSK